MMVRACLERQAKLGERVQAWDGTGASLTACENCPDGELARAGELNDDDIQGILTEKMEERAMAEEKKKMEEGRRKMEAKTKTCGRCEVPKPADTDHFSPDKKSRDGLRGYCKPCTADLARLYQEKKKKNAGETGKPDTGTRVRTPRRGVKVLKAGPRKRVARRSPTSLSPDAPIVLDFGPYPNLLKRLQTEASAAFRPIEMQILFMISEAAA
jgi:hypothetical protein